MSKDFDELIKDGEVVKAAYLFAEEGYENGEFGFTRKQLIEGLANRVQELERQFEIEYNDHKNLEAGLLRENKRYREALKLIMRRTEYERSEESRVGKTGKRG